MEIKVYFNQKTFADVQTTIGAHRDDYEPSPKDLKYVGTIEADNIDCAWALLQHSDRRDSVIPDERSASIGDVFQCGEDFFLVQYVGFKKLDFSERQFAQV